MVKKPKRTSKMLALLMAVVMTVGSVPTTAFAANSSSIGASSSSLEVLFRLWQPNGYRLLCRKRNHLLDSRICSLGRQRLRQTNKNTESTSSEVLFLLSPAYEGEVRMKRIARIVLWVIYKAIEKAFLLLLIASFIVVHVRLGMTVLGYIPFDQANGFILRFFTLVAFVSNQANFTFRVFADEVADEIVRR